MNSPHKVQIVKCHSSTLLVRFPSTGKEAKMPANEFIRKIDEGEYELIEPEKQN